MFWRVLHSGSGIPAAAARGRGGGGGGNGGGGGSGGGAREAASKFNARRKFFCASDIIRRKPRDRQLSHRRALASRSAPTSYRPPAQRKCTCNTYVTREKERRSGRGRGGGQRDGRGERTDVTRKRAPIRGCFRSPEPGGRLHRCVTRPLISSMPMPMSHRRRRGRISAISFPSRLSSRLILEFESVSRPG